MKNLLKKTALALGIAMALTSCESTTLGGVSGNDRSQLMLVDSAEVNAKAEQGYADVLRQAKAQNALNTDKKMTRRVKKIADRIIAQAPSFRPDCANWKWEVNVINSDELNAWCMPGGKIAVYTGIVKQLKLTDDEIAVIIGHEVTHALREHSREQMSTQMLKNSALSIASIFVDSSIIGISDTLADLGLMLPFSRSHETEADEIGLELTHKAGYNVDAGVSVWKKMAAVGGEKPPAILSTHPSDEDRLANLDRLAKIIKEGKSEKK